MVRIGVDALGFVFDIFLHLLLGSRPVVFVKLDLLRALGILFYLLTVKIRARFQLNRSIISLIALSHSVLASVLVNLISIIIVAIDLQLLNLLDLLVNIF